MTYTRNIVRRTHPTQSVTLLHASSRLSSTFSDPRVGWGIDVARSDDIHPDALRSQLQGHTLAKTDDAKFGSAVDRRSRRRAPPRDRADVYVAATGSNHVRDGGLGYIVHALQVYADELVEVLLACVCQRNGCRVDSRAIEYVVDVPMLGYDLLHTLFYISCFGHVEGEDGMMSATIGEESESLGEASLVNVRNDERSAEIMQFDRRASSDRG